MPSGYAATTQVESTLGDRFTAELSNLRVEETLPGVVGTDFALHVMPEGARLAFKAPRLATRRPSNIIPIGDTKNNNDVFYLGLDLEFVGTQLGHPHIPAVVSAEVRFFLEAYGTAGGKNDPRATHRHEINIQPQIFKGLNANPQVPATGDREIRHQLWVQVAKSDFPQIIEAPTQDPDGNPVAWEDLFNPGTIYRVAASVKLTVEEYIKCRPHGDATGFIEGLVMQTEEWDQYTGTVNPY